MPRVLIHQPERPASSARARKSLKRRTPPRFLFIAPQGLGDALQITPLLPGLKARYPEAIIDVLTLRPTSASVFRGLSTLVATVSHLPFWTRGRTFFVLALIRFVMTHRYEASFLAYPAARWQYQLVHSLIRSRCRVAHVYGGRRLLDEVPWFRTRRVPVTASVSNVMRNLDLVSSVVPDLPLASGYRIPEDWMQMPVPDEFIGAVIIHVGSISHDTFAAKRWPLASFIELATRLVRRSLRVAYLAGPDERAESLRAVSQTPGARLFEGSLQQTTSLFAHASLLVTNDTGMAHLANATGLKSISLFGPTPVEYAPYGPSAIALRPSSCPPCFDVRTSDMSCKRNIDYACLRSDLPVDLVERVALEALTAGSTGSPVATQ